MFENINDFVNLAWILILISLFIPALQKRLLAARRLSTIQSIEKKRQSRVITMIHRQETMSFFFIFYGFLC